MEIKRVHLPQVVAVAETLDFLDKAYGITREERELLDAMRNLKFEGEEDL